MDPDELRAMWEKHDRMLETSIRLNRQLLNATHLNRARSALQRLAVGLALEAILTLAAIVALGSFLYANRTLPRFACPAVALDLFAIATLNALIRQITLALQVDYDRPIATIQRQLETLRMGRIRYVQGIFLLATLVWTPMLIVMLKAFWGLDAYRLFGTLYLVANVLVGLAVIPVALWLSKRYGDRMGRSPLVQWLMRDLAGYNLNAATDFLATLSEFEAEK
jgi:hypothetical protein